MKYRDHGRPELLGPDEYAFFGGRPVACCPGCGGLAWVPHARKGPPEKPTWEPSVRCPCGAHYRVIEGRTVAV